MAATTAPRDWQHKCRDLKERSSHLLRDKKLSDCTFLVGQEPQNIKAHKLILAMASPVFESMFYGDSAETEDVIPVPDISPKMFLRTLDYIYMDKVNIRSIEDASELYYCGNKYLMRHLARECASFMEVNMDFSDVIQVYEFAKFYHEQFLMIKCLKLIDEDTQRVLASPGFYQADIKTLEAIFSEEYLNIDSELDLYYACLRYAETRDKWADKDKKSPRAVLDEPPVESSAKAEDNDNKTDGEKASCATVALEDQEGDSKETTDEEDNVASAIAESSDTSEEQGSTSAPREEDKAVDPELHAVIRKIRFLTLTPEQLGVIANSPLLTKSEAFAIIRNIISSRTKTPMPQGFSTSKMIRNEIVVDQGLRNICFLEDIEYADEDAFVAYMNECLARRGVTLPEPYRGN